jgi:MYND finger
MERVGEDWIARKHTFAKIIGNNLQPSSGDYDADVKQKIALHRANIAHTLASGFSMDSELGEWTRASQEIVRELERDPHSPQSKELMRRMRGSERSAVCWSGALELLLQMAGDELVGYLKRLPNEARAVSKTAKIIYAPRDDLTAEESVKFSKDYSNHQCASCHEWRTTAHKLSKCARCLTTYYCNPTCQRAHWPKHRQVCVKPTTR